MPPRPIRARRRSSLAAFRKLREFDAGLKLILAPRHPDRGAEVAALVAAAGQPMAMRSKGQQPGAATAVYLADTIGEMALWYRLAAITFVGGSLVAKGGHTPYEPAQCGSAILHGPHVANQAEAFRALDRAQGSVEVQDAGSLAAACLQCLRRCRPRVRRWRRAPASRWPNWTGAATGSTPS